MPMLNIDQFESEPKVGDEITVEGKVKSINADNGEVEVSYDKVSLDKKSKSSDEGSKEYSKDMSGYSGQSLDDALSKRFSNSR